MAKKIMILGASILQLPAIKKAKELGLDVVVVDMNPNAIGFNEPGIIKEVISTIDSEKVLEAARRHNIDGIMTLASDMPMRSVALVAKEMHLVGITPETALKATNKAEMRKALFEFGVPVPLFNKVSSEKEFLDVVIRANKELIVKPADNSGSRGVVRFSSNDDKQVLLDAYHFSRSSSRGGDVVVEEFMEGPEVSVETLSIDGECHVIQITDKLTTGAPHFVEMGHSQPSQLSEETRNRIKEVAIAANKAVGIENGPSHTEIIVTKEGPKIVEIGARLGGDCITTHLVPLSTGVDMVECCIKIALGEEPDYKAEFSKGSAIRYFHQHEGCIKEIEGVDDAKACKGIQQVSIVHNPGEEVTDVIDSSSRIGFVIAQASDAKEAVKCCEEAMSKIEVIYK